MEGRVPIPVTLVREAGAGAYTEITSVEAPASAPAGLDLPGHYVVPIDCVIPPDTKPDGYDAEASVFALNAPPGQEDEAYLYLITRKAINVREF